MVKTISTGFLRQSRKKRAKLNKNTGLSAYERYLKQKRSDFIEMDKLTDRKII